MNKASRIAAAFVLTLGLAACGGGAAGAASAAADSTSAADVASTADSTSATDTASTADTASAADSTSAATSTSTDTYENASIGVTYTPPAELKFSESNTQGSEFIAVSETGDSLNLIVGQLGAGEDLSDPAFMDQIKEEFTNSLDQQGIEGASVTVGEYTLEDGTSYPSILGSGTYQGLAIDLAQVYVQQGKQLLIFTCTSVGGVEIDDLMDGVTIK